MFLPNKKEQFHSLTSVQNVVPANISDSDILNILDKIGAGDWVGN